MSGEAAGMTKQSGERRSVPGLTRAALLRVPSPPLLQQALSIALDADHRGGGGRPGDGKHNESFSPVLYFSELIIQAILVSQKKKVMQGDKDKQPRGL